MAQKGTDKPLKHSLNTSNWNVECCGEYVEKHTQTGQRLYQHLRALTGGALVPKNLMLVFRGPEAVWTLMSGWTRALGSP